MNFPQSLWCPLLPSWPIPIPGRGASRSLTPQSIMTQTQYKFMSLSCKIQNESLLYLQEKYLGPSRHF